MDKACSHEYLIRFYSAVIFFQQFIELYIIEMLDRISPIIARGEFKDKELLRHFKEAAVVAGNEKTLSITRILKRLQLLFKAIENDSRFNILSNKTFLIEHLKTIKLLQKMRNDIVHSGKRVLTHYAYEVLFVSRVFPIVREVIKIEQNTTSMNRGLFCGINVIDEITKIKLPEEFSNPSTYDKNKKSLRHLTHLKELGRASLINSLYMGDWGNEKLKESLAIRNKLMQESPEDEARLLFEHGKAKKVARCPVCGTRSLTVVGAEGDKVAKCLFCAYSIESFVGEPKEFGIMQEALFFTEDTFKHGNFRHADRIERLVHKYSDSGHFNFSPHESLSKVCNAPSDKSGVYLIYEKTKSEINLIYVGSSGRKNIDGTIFIRNAGLGGIKDRLVNGKTSGKIPRRVAWPNQMREEGVESLSIHWYVTHGDDYSDCPRVVEKYLLAKHLENFAALPRWNKKK
jgi:hypothetical protein